MWLAFLITLLAGSSMALTFGVLIAYRAEVSDTDISAFEVVGYLVMLLPVSGWTLAGSVLAALRPRNVLGWLFLVWGLLLACGNMNGFLWSSDDAIAVALDWRTYLGVLLGHGSVLGAMTVILALYPDGRLPARWWRLPVAGVCIGYLLIVLSLTVLVGVDDIAVASGFVLGLVLVVPSAVVILVATFLRWRKAVHPYRQQLAWYICCGLVPLSIQYMPFFVPWTGHYYTDLLLVLMDPMNLLPVGVAVGILCYRLLGIRSVIRRGLVYAMLTVLVFGVYFTVTAVLGKLLEGSGLSAVLAAAVIAVLLAPARDRLQRAADRIVYGARRDPLQVLTDLGESVSGGGQLGLLPAAVTATMAAVRADGAQIVTLEGEAVATVGDAPGRYSSFPLRFAGEDLGELRIADPPGDSGYTRNERRLLTALAAQLAVVVRATELADSLDAERTRVVTATRDERDRLRRDLHDGLGPSLAGMGLGLQALSGIVADNGPATIMVKRLRDETDNAVRDIRRIIDALRPTALDTEGLTQAVERHAGTLRSALPVEVKAGSLPVLGPDVEVAAYRIITEALTNAARHADAHHARVEITADDALHIEVIDDGHGIRDLTAHPGVGLTSMRRRAEALGGDLAVDSTTSGTTVSATLPLRSE
jgi:signal transduction histidine kinase